MKSMLVNVFWPAFEWGPMGRPHERYLSFSYSANLTIRDNRRFRDLLCSEEFQKLYADRVTLRNDATNLVLNDQSGWKIASSVGGTATGHRASRILLDDPHSVAEAESEVVRSEAVRWFREAMSNRLQNVETDSIIVIMQRVHASDISGVILDEQLSYDHLMIAMNFSADRLTDESGEPVRTEIGWADPRVDDGALAWPGRFSEEACGRLRHELGPYAWAGQYQQSPSPRAGGILQRDWWQLLEEELGNKFPPTLNRIASLDGAFTEREEGDPSGFTIWGIFRDPKTKQNRACLMAAWRARLPLHGSILPRLAPETKQPGDSAEVAKWKDRIYKSRVGDKFGLVEKVRADCLRFDVDRLLIEAKGPGHSVAQEFRRLYSTDGILVELLTPRGDKISRAHATVPLFSQELVFAPDRAWAEEVITECANFPRSKHDDLVDSTTQALLWYRQNGLLRTGSEYVAEEHSSLQPRRLRPLYNV